LFAFFSQQLKMGDSEMNYEASGESSKLLRKRDESLALGSLHSGGTSRQHTESGPSTSTQNLPRQEERIEVGIDKIGFPQFQKHHTGISGVVALDNDKALSTLLTNSTTEVHSIDSKGNTALHHVVASELQPLLPTPPIESLQSSNIDKNLLAALQHNKYEVFLNYLSQTNHNHWYDEPYNSSLLEIACQMKNRKQFVKILLENGADPNITNRVTGMPLLHVTARSGNFEVLQLLLEKEGIDTSLKDNEKRTILHWLAGVNERKPGDKEKVEKCFSLLLDSTYIRKKGIDERDSLGNTALYITVESGFRDRAKLLLSKGADVRIFESGLSHPGTLS